MADTRNLEFTEEELLSDDVTAVFQLENGK